MVCGFGFSLVVPYVGTWIEMPIACYSLTGIQVVPYVGTWIEMQTT